MIYLRVPAVIYRAIRNVLDLFEQGNNIQWLQGDYDGDLQPNVVFDGCKFVFENGIEESDRATFTILKLFIENKYDGN